nr:hypothetical protein Itr_chr11CG16870 [Ipomoea trifida]
MQASTSGCHACRIRRCYSLPGGKTEGIGVGSWSCPHCSRETRPPCMSSTTRRGDHSWGVRRREVRRQHHRSRSLPSPPSVAAAIIPRCWLLRGREESDAGRKTHRF